MKRTLLVIFAILGLGLGIITASPQLTYADAKSDVLSGVQTAGGTGGPSVNQIISTVVNILSVLVGVVAVIMIIYAGFRYVTSGGDSSSITGAKNTMIYAIVGLVVVVLAQFIVQFVLDKLS